MERKRELHLSDARPPAPARKLTRTARINSVTPGLHVSCFARAVGGAAATPSRVLLPFGPESGRLDSSTGAMICIRGAGVSNVPGISAESPSTSRMRPTALWRLWSKSTKVSAGQKLAP